MSAAANWLPLAVLHGYEITVVVAGTAFAANHVYAHQAEAVHGWAEGVAQLAAWYRAAARTSGPSRAVVARAVRVLRVWVLAVRWPAHGRHRGHRAGVA